MSVVFWLLITDDNRPSLVKVDILVLLCLRDTRRRCVDECLGPMLLRGLEQVVGAIYIDLPYDILLRLQNHQCARRVDDDVWFDLSEDFLHPYIIGDVAIKVLRAGYSFLGGFEVDAEDLRFRRFVEDERDNVVPNEATAAYDEDGP